ncbi:MAG: ABC transporter ATP-binding protein [Firmicutes bacterium]|nr:ABC transporter ATP-binding protein [Bacillota bacterium]
MTGSTPAAIIIRWADEVGRMKIKIENLQKSYKLSRRVNQAALRGITVEIDQGEFCAVIGPSGSGKTTLLNILGCIDQPTTGRVYFDDCEVTALPERELVRIRQSLIGYIFQFFNLIPTLTAFENAQLPFWYAKREERERYVKNLDRLFAEIGISELKKRYPGQLSGGQQQRVAIARALAHFPKLVLADEPTGNLDSHNTGEIMALMKRESKKLGASFIVATHDLSLLEHFDKVIAIKDGMVERVTLNKNDETG